MSKDQPGKIIVDDDWKAQATKEKEELSSKLDTEAEAAAGELPPVSFIGHIESLAMQVMMSLGLIAHPAAGGRRIYDPVQARYLIDTIGMLRDKAKGNLSPEESKYLERIFPELQMTFVEVSRAVADGMVKTEKFDGKGAPPSGGIQA